jgi:hypothetical protein
MIYYGGFRSENEYRYIIETLDIAFNREIEDNNFASICQIHASKLAENS